MTDAEKSDLEFLKALGVPVTNMAARAGRTKTAILYEIDQQKENE